MLLDSVADVDLELSSARLDRRSSDRLMGVVQESMGVRTHSDLLAWLQGGFQALLPHEILLVVWGDPALDAFHLDVTSSLGDVRTHALTEALVGPWVHAMLARWTGGGHVPCEVALDPMAAGSSIAAPGFDRMHHALVHGIRNQRDQQLCLYMLLGSTAFPVAWERSLTVLLPFMDAALRQVDHLPTQRRATRDATPPAELDQHSLSEREVAILRWVAAGKTNEEIGLIVGISPFTVKNHLRRIFQKLNVCNRAQAVEKVLRHERRGEASERLAG